jgi:dephospho-CoA kinase
MPAPLVARIGLTGGIGSGKSTVATMWVRLGATLVDADAIGRRLTAAGGAAMPALRRAFGDAVAAPDGALDRDAMRQRVFADAAARHRLESVLHPMIGEQALLEAEESGTAVVVFDVPLLAESATWRRRVDRVLVVDCDFKTQLDRVSQRAGWTRETATQAISAQASRADRRAVADAVIHNAGVGLQVLQREVETLWHFWCNSGR